MSEGRLGWHARQARLMALALAALSCSGSDPPAGVIEGEAHAPAVVGAKAAAQARARERLAVPSSKSILFGDLHVHTTYSIDAFLYSLPVFGGAGAHPPADACDFARHCANLDFFSLNDHAEGLTPERWRRSIESVRECNARAGDAGDPDLVAFMGWEWTQTGIAPEAHFGHKNVIVPGLGEADIPPRPISALPDDVMNRARYLSLARAAEAVLAVSAPRYADFLWWIRRLATVPFCERDVDTRELPADCQENAATPEVLFEKLAQWGGPTLVIPHGLSWGIHAPPGARLDVQAGAGRVAPEVQRLVEVFSGHGSGERFEPVAAAGEDAALAGRCAEPTPGFLPCCWRAGEIIRERCGDLSPEACEARVRDARQQALAAGRRPHWVIPDASAADWLDCDQTRGAFKPALAHRPRQSAQYALATGAFRWGLIGSSDNHTARAGSGFKQVGRKGMTDARGIASERVDAFLSRFVSGRQEDPARAQASRPAEMGFRSLLDTERTASFLYTGGLVAVHAERRERRSIWQALMRREVYGTSGPRILLWFDLVDGQVSSPMGSEIELAQTPSFEVRAVGSFVQKPGCPPTTLEALAPERLESLCLGECYHPDDRRVPIEWIEVVRIRPKRAADEPVTDLVEDPWQRIPCPPDPAGCRVEFSDPDFAEHRRNTIYYVRALQAETPAINGATARVTLDPEGRAISASPCSGGYATPRGDDCLAPVRERAWSSPIFVDHAGG